MELFPAVYRNFILHIGTIALELLSQNVFLLYNYLNIICRLLNKKISSNSEKYVIWYKNSLMFIACLIIKNCVMSSLLIEERRGLFLRIIIAVTFDFIGIQSVLLPIQIASSCESHCYPFSSTQEARIA